MHHFMIKDHLNHTYPGARNSVIANTYTTFAPGNYSLLSNMCTSRKEITQIENELTQPKLERSTSG